MYVSMRGLAIAIVLAAAVALALPPILSGPNTGFTARAEIVSKKAKDKMTASEKTAEKVRELLMKQPPAPANPDNKAGRGGPATVSKVKKPPVIGGRLKTDATLSKSSAPCSDPECGGENKVKAGAAAQ